MQKPSSFALVKVAFGYVGDVFRPESTLTGGAYVTVGS